MTPIRIDKSKLNYTHPHKPRYVSPIMKHHKNNHNGTIRVVSYNIKYARKVDKAISLFSKQKELLDADVICLQEMDSAGTLKIAEKLNYNYVYYPAVRHPRHFREFGNAILSKWPILHDKKIILPIEKDEHLQRIAVGAIISAKKHRFVVFSIHMKVFLKSLVRKKQIYELLRSIPTTLDHCIIAGDFNTFSQASRKAIGEALAEENFHFALDKIDWSYKHWYLMNKKSLLDQIFVRGMTSVDHGKIVNRTPSDHIPIWVDLTFDKTKPKETKKKSK